jgi:hypothetical protein
MVLQCITIGKIELNSGLEEGMERRTGLLKWLVCLEELAAVRAERGGGAGASAVVGAGGGGAGAVAGGTREGQQGQEAQQQEKAQDHQK